MEIIREIKKVRKSVRNARMSGKTIGIVPTMGYLHDGHLSLVKIARKKSKYVVMTIFVNRLQFNDTNDFNCYPKDIKRDLEMAEKAGVDLVFIPDENEMYSNNLTTVNVDLLTDNLCGACRPGHFRGVFTVVSKLFNIVQPDIAVFGQKDIQQAVSIEKMVFDLNFPVKIIIAPIIREKDGLALSSRNKHLTEKQRKDALSLSRSLAVCKDMIDAGEKDVSKITEKVKSVIMEGIPDKIDYVSIVRYDDLAYISKIEGRAILAVAAFWGTTRLIDNMIIE